MAKSFPQRFGPYTLHELIARGGMAEIYRATMPGIGGFEKTVAIKKILPHLAESEEFITMLIDEARIIVSINHFNIAQVYDLGAIDGTYYIAMEFIHGIDLAGIIKILAKQNRTVPPEHATYIASGICAGLHVAHSKADENGRPLNIVHRDVSPHNVLISYSGDVKIIDFGVAKANSKETHTQMGVIKGKLLYMAPEQAMAKTVDGRSDLFAAGLVIYKMLTNHLPFEGENEFQIYNNILTKEIVPPNVLNPEVPEQLSAIVMKMLARAPEDRYPDGYAAKHALDHVLQSLWPGYTVNRLSRFVEDNFSNHREQSGEKQDISSAASLAPQTPAPVQHHRTGPQMLAQTPVGQRDRALEDAHHTVDLRPPEGLARNQNTQPPAGGNLRPPPQQDSYRATLSQEITGNNNLPPVNPNASSFQDPAHAAMPGATRAKSPVLIYAIIATILVIIPLLAYQIFMKPAAPEPTASVADASENRAPTPEPPTAPAPWVTVHLDTTPDGANLYQENSFVGITPIVLEIERGDQPIQYLLRKPGFIDWPLTIMPDDDISHTIELLVDNNAQETVPAGALVQKTDEKNSPPEQNTPPKIEKPVVAQPKVEKPVITQPKVAQPKVEKPKTEKPKTEKSKNSSKPNDDGSKPVKILNPFDF